MREKTFQLAVILPSSQRTIDIKSPEPVLKARSGDGACGRADPLMSGHRPVADDELDAADECRGRLTSGSAEY